MIEFLMNHFDAIFTSIITILGFVVTYILTKKNFNDEIKKDKINRATEAIQTLPYDICQLMDEMIKNNEKSDINLLKNYGDILSKVLSYGSKDAVKIAIKMQQLCYASENQSEEPYSILAAYALLITQLKYDLTGEIISPESWFQLRMKDYNTVEAKMKILINKLIQLLDLNQSFRV